MWVMIAGPYRSGAPTPEAQAENLRAMNRMAWQVFQLGHTPIIGVNQALPVIEAAGEQHFETLMMPISLALAQRCDAILRIGGPSTGADQEMEVFRERGLPIYRSVEEIPPLA